MKLDLGRADRIALAVLVPLALLLAFVVARLLPRSEGSELKQPSTFFNARYGTKAAYLSLEQLGRRVSRLRRPLVASRLDGVATLFLLEPVRPVTKEEREVLLDWVARGGTLVVAPNADVDLGVSAEDVDASSAAAHWSSAGTVEQDASLPGVHRLAVRSKQRLMTTLSGALAPDRSKVLWRDGLGALMLRVSHGDGTILALASASPLANAGLHHDDNPLLLADLATASARDGKLEFDEYHLGFAKRDVSAVAIAKLTFDEPWRPLAIQVLLAALLALLAGAVRFGAARDPPPPPRRRLGELAESAGRLYREAGAQDLVMQRLHRYYRDALCAETGLATDAADSELVSRLSTRLRGASAQDPGSALADARAACELGPAVREQDMVSSIRRLHQLLEATKHAAR